VLPRDVRNFVELGLTQRLREDVEARFGRPGARRALPTEAHVMGRAYSRFEEGYGDAKNLRGRHPLAALGFLFVVGSDIPPTSLDFAVDMLRKLTSEPDVYDCACLLIVDGTTGTEEDEAPDDRGVEDEPAAVLSLSVSDCEDDEPDLPDEPAAAPDATPAVRILSGSVPPDLGADAFFRVLIDRALERMPVGVYPTVRARRAGRV
jgi:hypothetical protein